MFQVTTLTISTSNTVQMCHTAVSAANGNEFLNIQHSDLFEVKIQFIPIFRERNN